MSIAPGRSQRLSIFRTTFVSAAIGVLAAFVLQATHVFGAHAQSAAGTPRGIPGDFWADIQLGQRDFAEINERLVVGYKLKQPGGLAVDRSAAPGRLYVWDSGNNRILGVDLSSCYGEGSPCSAGVVLGQPRAMDFGACNRDASFAGYPQRAPASASTLCGVSEDTTSVTRDRSAAGLFVDAQGNLFVPDVRNHRVLQFKAPIVPDASAVAVWGQRDFAGNQCNGADGQPGADTLCLGDSGAGVTLDRAGNLWVADAGNNRVLRFPNAKGAIAQTADLVLGQASFASTLAGRANHQLTSPTQLRFDGAGNLLVLDAADVPATARIVRFHPPFVSGMSGEPWVACRQWDARHEQCTSAPAALEVDERRGGVWVIYNEAAGAHPLLHAFDGTIKNNLSELASLDAPAAGSIALDHNGDLLISSPDPAHEVVRITQDSNGRFKLKQKLFSPPEGANLSAPTRPEHPLWGGVTLAGNQIIVSDGRLLFWNDRRQLTSGKSPDGTISASDARSAFGQIQTDADGRVWVTRGSPAELSGTVEVYQAPLKADATPIKVFSKPIPVLGGGSVRVTHAVSVAPSAHGEFVWISEPANHRVLRVRAPLSANPVVDVILGQSTLAQADDPNPPQCNRGETQPAPDAALDMLCYPGAIALDRKGNLFVSDHFPQTRGNLRLLAFAPPAPTSAAIRMPSAAKAFTGSAQGPYASFAPAFDSANRMVIGFNPLWGPRFVSFYRDPIALNADDPFDSTYAQPDGQLNDFFGWPLALAFDADDNLYAYDADRKLLVYLRPLASVPLPAPDTSLPAGSDTGTSGSTSTPDPKSNKRDDDDQPRAKAPVEVLVDRASAPMGIVPAPDALYFTDGSKGTLNRRNADGTTTVLLDRLSKPRGLARLADGSLALLADDWHPKSGATQKGVALAWNAKTGARVLGSNFRAPQQALVSAQGLMISTTEGLRGEKRSDDDDEAADGVVYRLNGDGTLVAAVRGLRAPSGIAQSDDGTLAIAAEQLRLRKHTTRGNLFGIDTAGNVSALLADRYDAPAGVVRDALGAYFVAVAREREDADDGGLIVKVLPDGHVRNFAKHMGAPWGLALDANGHLYASDPKTHRIYRFRAPAAPFLAPVPPVTNQPTSTLIGNAEPGAQVTVIGGAATLTTLADASGAFHLEVVLKPDTTNTLSVFATGAAGDGLTGPAITVSVEQDSLPPQIVASATPSPTAFGWNNTPVMVSFRCSDSGSGLASCPDPVKLTGEGAGQIVRGTASDRAGNSATVTFTVNIDMTPPTAQVTSDPPANAQGWHHTDVTATFICSDSLSGVDQCPAPQVFTDERLAQAAVGTVTDRAGNSANVGAAIRIDRTPPEIQLDGSDIEIVPSGARIDLRGTVTDAFSGVRSLNCGGVPTPLARGHFSCSVTAHDGVNRIDLEAADNAGGTSIETHIAIAGAGLASTHLPRTSAIGDFNRDGIPDVAVPDAIAGTVTISLGRGDGTFTKGVVLATGGVPSAIAAADFDGDGILDLAVTSAGLGIVSVYKGWGDGRFDLAQVIPVGALPLTLAAADLNGDGLADLVVGNYDSSDASVILSKAGGGFAPAQRVALGVRPIALTLAHVDRDGNIDLAAAEPSGAVSILRGTGNGGFTPMLRTKVGLSPLSIVAQDVTGDGIVDFVSANNVSKDVSVLVGRADGTFEPEKRISLNARPVSIVVADVNADGFKDLLVASAAPGEVSVLLSKGGGVFEAQAGLPAGVDPTWVGTADVNRDGVPDLVTASARGAGALALLGSGQGAFRASVFAGRVTTIRNNGDPSRRLDLVILGDGYTEAEMSKYANDAEAAMKALFDEEPFREYAKFFNVHRIDLASKDSGISHPLDSPPILKDTAFSGSFCDDATGTGLCANYTKVRLIASLNLRSDQRDVYLLVMNDSQLGGANAAPLVSFGRANIAMVTTGGNYFRSVKHELGHAIGLLADEYVPEDYNCLPAYFGRWPNITMQTDYDSIPWHHWIDRSTPLPTPPDHTETGLYEGAKLCPRGVYRPTADSIMRYADSGFGPVNSEELVKRVHDWTGLIDSTIPEGDTITVPPGGKQTISVKTTPAATHGMDIVWRVNNEIRGTGPTFEFQAPERNINPFYNVTAEVHDPTAFVRNDPGGTLTQTKTWLLQLGTETSPFVVTVVDYPSWDGVATLPMVLMGWALDVHQPLDLFGYSSGVSSVQIWANKRGVRLFLGEAALGEERPDVAAKYGAQYGRSGFSLRIDPLQLPFGDWELEVITQSSRTGQTDTLRQPFHAIPGVNPQRDLVIEDVPDFAQVNKGFDVKGWAVDLKAPPGSGPGIESVTVELRSRGEPTQRVYKFSGATLGIPNEHAALLYGPNFQNAGFSLFVGPPVGSYDGIVHAISAIDKRDDTRAFRVDVAPPLDTGPVTTPRMALDNPEPAMVMSSPFSLWGWAIDQGAPTGTGVDQIRAIATPLDGRAPITLDGVRLGLSRPDVAQAFKDSRFTNSGFALDGARLPVGDYKLDVSARSTLTDTFNDTATAVPLKIVPGGPGGLNVRYQAHVQDAGWLGFVDNGSTAGTTGQGKRMEAVRIELENNHVGAQICFEAHVQNVGWQGERCAPDIAGTTGQSLRMEALRVRLVGAPPGTHVCYRAHVQNIGWQTRDAGNGRDANEWCDGEVAGTTGQSLRMEAVRIYVRQ